MEKEKIIELAKLLYFKPTEKVINLLLDEEKKVLNGLKQIDKLDLSNVEPLDRVDEKLEDLKYLRKDDILLSKEKWRKIKQFYLKIQLIQKMEK